tara:strand:- start:118 stop:564 length:447 start_codon:yes stop_codon:yes gene_type:complete
VDLVVVVLVQEVPLPKHIMLEQELVIHSQAHLELHPQMVGVKMEVVDMEAVLLTVEEAEVVPVDQVLMEQVIQVVMVVQDIWSLQHLETQHQHYYQDQDLQIITSQVEEVVVLMEPALLNAVEAVAVLLQLLMLVLELDYIVVKEQMF